MKAILALGLATLLLAACGLNRPAVERQSFVLAPLRATAAAPATGPSVKLGGVEVAPPFDGRGFVYRREGQRFESDFYNEFAAAPAELLGQATATWLRRSGLFAAVIESRLAGGADLRIDTAVSALYVDFTDEGPQPGGGAGGPLAHHGGGPGNAGGQPRRAGAAPGQNAGRGCPGDPGSPGPGAGRARSSAGRRAVRVS